MKKLVRDLIPQTIRDSGLEPIAYRADANEFMELLREKLLEETGEYLESGEAEELADCLEVLLALAQLHGLTAWELDQLRVRKRAERGGFDDRIVWCGNQ